MSTSSRSCAATFLTRPFPFTRRPSLHSILLAWTTWFAITSLAIAADWERLT